MPGKNIMHAAAKWVLKFGALVLILSAGAVSCHKAEEPPAEIKTEMRDSYSASYALFRDIWSPERFSDPQNRENILALLDRLSANFHGVKVKTPSSTFDSGFAVTLQLNQEILYDAKRRFGQGHTEYAAWRLRSLMHNCIACHTRYQAPIGFVGESPAPASKSAEDALTVANFLVASRQFDKASTELWKLASSPGGISSSEQPEFRALRLWLVVQLRSKPNFMLTAHQLKEISTLVHFRGKTNSVSHWIRDLERFGKAIKPPHSLDDAKELLRTLSSDNLYTEDDEALVPTLLATTILHNLLPDLDGRQKRQATWLLGFAYHHIQIQEFDVFRSLYLEQCIREFPNTEEAQKAVELYEKEARIQSSGSAGLQMEEEDLAKIQTLRELAFPDATNTTRIQ